MILKGFSLLHLAVLLWNSYCCCLSLHYRNSNYNNKVHRTRFRIVRDLRNVPFRKLHPIQSSSEDTTTSNRRGIIETVGSFFNRLRRSTAATQHVTSTKTKDSIAVIEKKEVDVVIVGGGIAGLSCAKSLLESGLNNSSSVLILEAESKAGGRVGTDQVDGYLLDRGFQVFIDSYPEAKALFDYDRLQLRPFLPGALVRFDKKLWLVSDPLRRPGDLLDTMLSPVGSLLDKIKVGILSIYFRLVELQEILRFPESNTADYLSSSLGLSDSMIDRFFNPFYQGIFLSPLSEQSSRMFGFLFKMFTEGAATLPAKGMQAIPDQLVEDLTQRNGEGVCLFNTKVSGISVDDIGAITVHGRRESNAEDNTLLEVRCRQVVIATCPPRAKQLTDSIVFNGTVQGGEEVSKIDIPTARSSVCVYFGFEGLPPMESPILILNGESKLSFARTEGGPPAATINNICFPSQVSREYAPEGKSLASVTIVGTPDLMARDSVTGSYLWTDEWLERTVRSQLSDWWGSQSVDKWTLLRIYRIPYAQPAQSPLPYAALTSAAEEEEYASTRIGPNIYCCGDHRNTATLNGAIRSGKLASQAVLKDRKRLL